MGISQFFCSHHVADLAEGVLEAVDVLDAVEGVGEQPGEVRLDLERARGGAGEPRGQERQDEDETTDDEKVTTVVGWAKKTECPALAVPTLPPLTGRPTLKVTA